MPMPARIAAAFQGAEAEGAAAKATRRAYFHYAGISHCRDAEAAGSLTC